MNGTFAAFIDWDEYRIDGGPGGRRLLRVRSCKLTGMLPSATFWTADEVRNATTRVEMAARPRPEMRAKRDAALMAGCPRVLVDSMA